MEASTLGETEHHHLSDPGKEARSKSGVPVVPVFDGYRALAILGVVALHLVTASGVVNLDQEGTLARLVWGTFGRSVEVLFVVSGFVVFLPTVARNGGFGSIWPYFIRRGARLLPAYWLILVISLILLATVDVPGYPGLPNLPSVIANFTGTGMPATLISSHISIGFGVNAPLWTLSVELGFYLVLPLVAAWYFRRPWLGLGIAALITVLWHEAFAHTFEIANLFGIYPSFKEGFRVALGSGAQLPVWALSFGLGMTGAWVFVRLRERRDDPVLRRRILAVAITAIASTVVFAWVNGGYFSSTHESLWLTLAFSVSIGTAMVAVALAPPALQFPFANGPVRTLGDISYGIYLSHMLLMIYLGHFLSIPTDGTAKALLFWVAAVLPASILYGYLSARFLEQPIRRWARRFGRRSTI